MAEWKPLRRVPAARTTKTQAQTKRADVAQLVEQLIRNQQVSGSSPLVGSRTCRPAEEELAMTPRVRVRVRWQPQA